MPEPLAVLLDQNVPRAMAVWLQERRPSWSVHHAAEVGLALSSDADLFAWAQTHDALVVTFDEDFADQRSFPVGEHRGVVRLRVWPTTIEEAQDALGRLLEQVTDDELIGALVIIDRARIRVRHRRPRSS